MAQRRDVILSCEENPVYPYEQVIRAVHTDSRQGAKEHHRWLYQVSSGIAGPFSFFDVTTYARKTVAYPYECHCRDADDEWVQEERECCYCLDDNEPPEPHCLCVTGDNWEIIATNRAFGVKKDTGDVICHADPSKVLPVWVIDHIRKGLGQKEAISGKETE